MGSPLHYRSSSSPRITLTLQVVTVTLDDIEKKSFSFGIFAVACNAVKFAESLLKKIFLLWSHSLISSDALNFA